MTSTFAVFLICQLLVVLFIALHDWIPLGRLNNLEGVRGVDSTVKLFFVTVLSMLPFAVGLSASVYFAPIGNPHWLTWWLWITYGFAIYGMMRAWYWPYLFGGDPARVERYKQRFANTRSFLPTLHGIRPDTLHVCFHVVLVSTCVLLVVLTFRDHVFAFG